MFRHLPAVPGALILAVTVSVAAGCSSVDLKTAVQITDVSSGYYDAGLTETGLNKLVPSITFTIHNAAETKLSSVDMIVLFWQDGADAEADELVVKAISGSGIPPGGATDPLGLRASVGYTLQQPRAELFTHSQFKDMKAKLFAKRGGRIVPAGEYPIERRLLLNTPTESASK